MSDVTAEHALIEQALSHYDVPWSRIELLPAWYGTHLRVRICKDASGGGYQLRERPPHIPLEAWRLHHELQPATEVVRTVPPLFRTRAGDCYVSLDGRDFELIGWFEGESQGLVAPEHFQRIGRAIGELHSWLFQVPAPQHSQRTIATTNDMQWWIGELRRDAPRAEGTDAFCDLAESLLAELPPGPQIAVHGDIHPYNVVWKDGEVSGFCDWEDAHLNAPMFDLAYLLTHSTFITWPKRLESGREAFVREEVDMESSRLLLTAYKEAMPLKVEVEGFRRALVTSWVSTMRLTVLRNFIDEPTIAAGRRLLDWLADPDSIREWEAIVEA